MIVIGLGANLDGIYGTPEDCFHACTDLFSAADIHIVKSSNIWKTAPVPASDQPWYRNAVCAVDTDLDPHQLLSTLAEIEENTGRVRVERNEARVLDLDLLIYNNRVIEDKGLKLPHPRLHERAFVLYPLQEIMPEDWKHPVLDKTVGEMIKTMPKGQKAEPVENSALANIQHGRAMLFLE